jgi:hypothetical protein
LILKQSESYKKAADKLANLALDAEKTNDGG